MLIDKSAVDMKLMILQWAYQFAGLTREMETQDDMIDVDVDMIKIGREKLQIQLI